MEAEAITLLKRQEQIILSELIIIIPFFTTDKIFKDVILKIPQRHNAEKGHLKSSTRGLHEDCT
jgi:hypothetical protein